MDRPVAGPLDAESPDAAVPDHGSVGGGSPPALVLVALVALLVPAWAVGLAPVLWLAVIPPTAGWLLATGGHDVRLPRYFGAWAVFLLFALCSVVQLEGVGALAIWGLRYGWYVAATLLVVYLVNQREATVPIGLSLAALWAITIAGGWAGMLAPDVSWTGVFARMLPSVIGENPFVVDLTSPALAEVQRVGGEVLRRPSAPFPYTNTWGSTLVLLVPIALATGTHRRFGMSRVVLALMALASVPPLVASLNRGAWLSLVIAGAYVGQHVLRGRRGAQVAIAAVLLVVVGAAVVSGAAARVSDQLSARTQDSNETRTVLYRETITDTLESPLLGYGAPRQSTELEGGPPVGTHGQLWMVMFSHGIIAAAGYVAFFGLTFLAFPVTSTASLLAKASLLVGLFQLPFYGQLPQQVFVLMAIVAFLHHEHDRHRAALDSTSQPART